MMLVVLFVPFFALQTGNVKKKGTVIPNADVDLTNQKALHNNQRYFDIVKC